METVVHPYIPNVFCVKRGFCISSSVFNLYSCLTRPLLTLLNHWNLAKIVEYLANTDPADEQCPAMPRKSKIPSTWRASWAMNTFADWPCGKDGRISRRGCLLFAVICKSSSPACFVKRQPKPQGVLYSTRQGTATLFALCDFGRGRDYVHMLEMLEPFRLAEEMLMPPPT
jgi:hypothetical protein